MDEISPKEGNKLALFDFDGTLTHADTMFEFILFMSGRTKLMLSLVRFAPIMALTKLGFYSAEEAKKKLLKWHIGGMTEDYLKRCAETFCMDVLPKLFRDDALEKLHFHRSKKHHVFIVTASLDLWIQPWLTAQNLPGACTKIAWEDGVFKGNFASPNCNGPEKAVRIKEALDLASFDRIYAYGDSKGDKQMFALAHRVFYKKFL